MLDKDEQPPEELAGGPDDDAVDVQRLYAALSKEVD